MASTMGTISPITEGYSHQSPPKDQTVAASSITLKCPGAPKKKRCRNRVSTRNSEKESSATSIESSWQPPAISPTRLFRIDGVDADPMNRGYSRQHDERDEDNLSPSAIQEVELRELQYFHVYDGEMDTSPR